MSMTLAETFRTDVRERAEEPWGQTEEDYSNQSKKHLRHWQQPILGVSSFLTQRQKLGELLGVIWSLGL